MNLDDLAVFEQLDRSRMIDHIDRLPDQLEQAWQLGVKLPLPEHPDINQIVVAGMGGSAIGADLLAAYAAESASIPLIVWRNYELPAFALHERTLLVASSHSGNTEETLSAYHAARQAGIPRLAVTTGGQLAELAANDKQPLWRFDHIGQPRAAVGFSFGLLLALLHGIGGLGDPSAELGDAVDEMKAQQATLRPASPVVENPAKRMAGQLMERWPTIIGAGLLAPVARRWRTQISELAKAPAQFEELPEADHNMLAGTVYPEGLLARTMVVFLQAAAQHPRNLLRLDLTRQGMMVEGFNTDMILGRGESRMAQQWTCLHYGDYVAYYLAMAYGADPTPVEALESLKIRLLESS